MRVFGPVCAHARPGESIYELSWYNNLKYISIGKLQLRMLKPALGGAWHALVRAGLAQQHVYVLYVHVHVLSQIKRITRFDQNM